MTEVLQPPMVPAGRGLPSFAAVADRALKGSAAVWLGAALIGQWAFFAYIASFYGASALTGHPEHWNRLSILGRHPYVPGDAAGNLATPATRSPPGSSPSAAPCSCCRGCAPASPRSTAGTAGCSWRRSRA